MQVEVLNNEIIDNTKGSLTERSFRNSLTIEKEQGFQGLKVHALKWNLIGREKEFEIDKPIMISVGESNKKSADRLLYVWRTPKEFKIFDVESRCPYEWKTLQGQVMIRRRLGEAVPESNFSKVPENKLKKNILGKALRFFI